MKTIYIDNEYKCHVRNDGTMKEVETDFFDWMCDSLIECYKYIPNGNSWTRNDGVVFYGEMIAPWKSFLELKEEQEMFEKQLLIDCLKALSTLGVNA